MHVAPMYSSSICAWLKVRFEREMLEEAERLKSLKADAAAKAEEAAMQREHETWMREQKKQVPHHTGSRIGLACALCSVVLLQCL